VESRIYVVVGRADAAQEALIDQLLRSEQWSLDAFATQLTPSEVRVLAYDAGSEDREGLLGEMAQVHGDLEEWGVQPIGIAGHVPDDPRPMPVMALMGGSGLDPLYVEVVDALFGHGDAPAETSVDATRPPGPTRPPEDKSDSSPAGADTAAAKGGSSAASQSGEAAAAAVLTATVGLLADPAPLWTAVGRDGRELARTLLKDAYADRSASVRQSGWVTGAELVLLDAIDDPDTRRELAVEMLQVRERLTEADGRLREARAELQEQRVRAAVQETELAKQHAALAEQGVKLIEEGRAQMAKWRSFADVGVTLLIFTTVISLVAAGYVLLQVDKIDAWAAPVLIFVLALFAISPAVLLLNERPLKGIDAWMPAGATGDDRRGASDDSRRSDADGAAKDDASKDDGKAASG
jgi:hypothetical protein